jgi:hypothetical protein
MEDLPASCPMPNTGDERWRFGSERPVPRPREQRADTLAKNKNVLFISISIEFVGRWDAGLAAGKGTNDLKTRLDGL